ncbi:DHA2 family efflux MFS transporter permease subunit [Proteus sp. GOKU]|uniref:DHA2 family efflux MFS transporter permease subunit n=1 Tax=Proteus TaxID=583 RepID=UPI001892CBB7|nr:MULTISPECIES: DHA2 family efflux MFS transporter permease subunit [Proteus]QPB78790.1 DHA2 family efflux MFS transporter permease subunit [Proteus sp. GOKU]QQP24797.1 DHA2 family efflux MFS transporter permease subunit [Proteus vulgaris]WPD00024.1 DHA2 family efflux MFS transporter permease subunit [Proteus terrae]
MNMENKPLKGIPLIWGTIAIALANFMIVLDTTIANVSIPTISGDLGISTTEGTWVITSYAVAEAITVPLAGWLVKRFGQIRLFISCVIIFMFFSLLCGLSWSLESLVLFRILQGLSGGPLIPLSATLLISIYPKDKSTIAVALWGMTTVVAPIIGPILGGWLCDNYSWPWIFYINLPIGILIGISAWILLRSRETEKKRIPIDIVGLTLLIIFVSALQLMIDKGKELDWFSSSFIIICAVISVISLIFFVIWELTDANPIVDLSVFKSRNWILSTLAVSLMFGLFFGNVVISPIWLQQQMGYTAFWAGLVIAPMGILSVVTSPIVGKLLQKLDPRWIVTCGLCILALSFYLRALFTIDVGYWEIALPMFILGAGVPACIVTLTSLGVSDLPSEKVTNGAGLQNFFRVMSMAIGGSLSQTYWEHQGKVNRAELVSIIDINNMPNSTIDSSLNQFSLLVDQQAMMLATNDFYALACILMLIFAVVVWFIKPSKAPLKQNTGH